MPSFTGCGEAESPQIYPAPSGLERLCRTSRGPKNRQESILGRSCQGRELMNVLLITSDQHLAACLGHEGHPQVLTLNLDRLATGAMRFRHAYTQSPICTPTRTSVFSGQYCHNHGFYGLSDPALERLPSFLSHFKQHGYYTAGAGNLHVPNNPRNWLEHLEHHVDFLGECCNSVDGKQYQSPFYGKIRQLGLLEKGDFYLSEALESQLYLEGMASELPSELPQEGWCAEQTVQFTGACAGRSFCMEASLERPHSPWFPARQFWDMYPDDLALPPTVDQDPSGRPPHFRAAYEAFHNHPLGVGAERPRSRRAPHMARLPRLYYARGPRDRTVAELSGSNRLGEGTVGI